MKEDCVLLEKLRKLQRVVLVLCALCALGFKKDGEERKLERYISSMGIDITTYRIRIGRFGPGRGYISTGIAEIYSSSITGSDIHYGVINIPIEMLRDDSAGRDNARCLYVCSASCQSMAHVAIYVNLHTRIRAVRPSTCFGLV